MALDIVHRDVGVFDAHCHPTDIMSSADKIPKMKARVLTVMSTRSQDQDLVSRLGDRYKVSQDNAAKKATGGVVPAFGWHPWFSHLMWDDRDSAQTEVDAKEHYSNVLTPAPGPDDHEFVDGLAVPTRLTEFLAETEKRLHKFPLALVGEVGLDRGFRIPQGPHAIPGDVSMKTGGKQGEGGEYTGGSREGRPLTRFKVQMEQQKTILRAQLELAGKHQRPVSVHSVQAHGVVFEVLSGMWKGHERLSKRQRKKQKDAAGAVPDNDNEVKNDDQVKGPLPYPPRICMHSYSGPPDALRLFLDPKVPADVYFSFSELINFSNPTSNKAVDTVKAVPDDRILIESDLHCAGFVMDDLLEKVLVRVCEIKGWELQAGAQTLKSNWQRFVFGSDQT